MPVLCRRKTDPWRWWHFLHNLWDQHYFAKFLICYGPDPLNVERSGAQHVFWKCENYDYEGIMRGIWEPHFASCSPEPFEVIRWQLCRLTAINLLGGLPWLHNKFWIEALALSIIWQLRIWLRCWRVLKMSSKIKHECDVATVLH